MRLIAPHGGKKQPLRLLLVEAPCSSTAKTHPLPNLIIQGISSFFCLFRIFHFVYELKRPFPMPLPLQPAFQLSVSDLIRLYPAKNSCNLNYSVIHFGINIPIHFMHKLSANIQAKPASFRFSRIPAPPEALKNMG